MSVMGAASPTPVASSHFGQSSRRAPSRQAFRRFPSRPHNSRSDPPISLPAEDLAVHARQLSLNDSSDDEIPVPMKFSALTKALLSDEASILPPSSPVANSNNLSGSTVVNEGAGRERAPTDGSMEEQAYERTSPEAGRSNSLHKRIVRLSGTPKSLALRRTCSLSSAVQKCEPMFKTGTNKAESPVDLNTPSRIVRTVRIPITASGNHRSSVESSGKLSSRTNSSGRMAEGDFGGMEDPVTVSRTQAVINHGSVSRYGTIGRNRYGDETGIHSSMRPKRLGKVAGTFLSGPARRGRRRQSEDEQEPCQDNEDRQGVAQKPENQDSQIPGPLPSHEYMEGPSYYDPKQRDFALGSPIDTNDLANSQPNASPEDLSRSSPSLPVEAENKFSPQRQLLYRIPAPRSDLPSVHDQENEAPPTFKRSKPVTFAHLDKMEKLSIRPQDEIGPIRSMVSPQRRPLATKSQNTPHRVAPPPPKMSKLETATATGGAAATSHGSKKGRNTIRVNGKIYTRMDVIGRGGSSKVWRVMAENYKVFALKRVSLEDADENAIRGYKGEIDLLKKLEGIDRVVDILDYEMNDEKQTLSVLMEMGETDFNKMLELRFNAENATFDPSFTRHYWKEMLECIQAVHNKDIIHSDLKPANFVLVQGRLKLIDFGIANAIQTDETVNVHRDTQIGTPNYMSPESLMDHNDLPGAKKSASSEPKIMKIGKPSDIWSLGCILYQMSYGRQPFAHIKNQMARCRAIIDFSYAIEFLPTGLGGIKLPKSLIKTMKKCLDRDQHQRPTVEELLDIRDPFLNPFECEDGSIPMNEELLGRILHNAAHKCKDRFPSDVELLSLWPGGYFASIRKSMT